MGETERDMKQVVTTMTTDMAARVTAIADDLGMSVATLLRVAVIQYLRQYERAGVLPTLEPIGDQLKRM
jgi:transposase-like protein